MLDKEKLGGTAVDSVKPGKLRAWFVVRKGGLWFSLSFLRH